MLITKQLDNIMRRGRYRTTSCFQLNVSKNPESNFPDSLTGVSEGQMGIILDVAIAIDTEEPIYL